MTGPLAAVTVQMNGSHLFPQQLLFCSNSIGAAEGAQHIFQSNMSVLNDIAAQEALEELRALGVENLLKCCCGRVVERGAEYYIVKCSRMRYIMIHKACAPFPQCCNSQRLPCHC